MTVASVRARSPRGRSLRLSSISHVTGSFVSRGSSSHGDQDSRIVPSNLAAALDWVDPQDTLDFADYGTTAGR
jgi:hypothetical protein